jgi:mannose-6-phosphate isomerase-like protein (cupin superfamily)
METLAPHGDSPPLHVHLAEDEVFHVLEGAVRLRVNEEELLVRAGDTVLGPRGVPHTYFVESARGRWLIITAHGNHERFVRSMSRPAERPWLPEPSPLTAAQRDALIAAGRDHELDFVGPPLS